MEVSAFVIIVLLLFAFGIWYITRKPPEKPVKPRFLTIDTWEKKD